MMSIGNSGWFRSEITNVLQSRKTSGFKESTPRNATRPHRDEPDAPYGEAWIKHSWGTICFHGSEFYYIWPRWWWRTHVVIEFELMTELEQYLRLLSQVCADVRFSTKHMANDDSFRSFAAILKPRSSELNFSELRSSEFPSKLACIRSLQCRFLCPWDKMDPESRSALPQVLRESLETEGATLTGKTTVNRCITNFSRMDQSW